MFHSLHDGPLPLFRTFMILTAISFFSFLQSLSMAKETATERIVFLGDSITQAGNKPGGYVALVRESIGQTDSTIDVVGAGISGNRVPDLQKRLKRDVLSKHPTTTVIYIGINDVWHSQNGRGTSKDEYETGLRDIIRQIKAGGSKVILCTASVIGEKTDGSNPLDAMLDEYCDISRAVAKETGSQMLDLRAAFLDQLKQQNGENAEKGILTSDGVHLNPAGNRFVADQMLAALDVNSNSKPDTRGKVLRHIVMFKFVDGLAEPEINKIADAFAELPNQIDTIVDYEHGTNVSEENKAQGFTHAFIVTFADQSGIDAYLPHAAHQNFVGLLGGKIDKVLVFDFWTPAE